jgi:hypothetical protein
MPRFLLGFTSVPTKSQLFCGLNPSKDVGAHNFINMYWGWFMALGLSHNNWGILGMVKIRLIIKHTIIIID